jgi:hypothetical protein
VVRPHEQCRAPGHRRVPGHRRAPSVVHRAVRVRPGRGVDLRRPGAAATGRLDILVRAMDTPLPGDPARGSAMANPRARPTPHRTQPVARTATGSGRTRTAGHTGLPGTGSSSQASDSRGAITRRARASPALAARPSMPWGWPGASPPCPGPVQSGSLAGVTVHSSPFLVRSRRLRRRSRYVSGQGRPGH